MQTIETGNNSKAQQYTPAHAGHGHVYRGNLIQPVNATSINLGHPAPPPQHPSVPAASALPSAISEGYPLCHDAAGNLQFASANAAIVSGTESSYSQAATFHTSSRRPSVSLSARRNKSSRNYPYTLRAASSSVSSVASNSSAHSHSSQAGTPGVYVQANTSLHASPYPNLGTLAPASTEGHAVIAHTAQAASGAAVSLPAWSNPDYFHSRSSSISSVSSDCSSSSHASSGWSDVSNSRDMSRVDISYTPSFDSNTAFMPKQSFTPASYHSSPATQFPQPRTTTPEHTASLACLDVGVSQSFHNAGTQQVQSYGVQSSPPAGLPVNRSSIADPSTGSRYSYPPIPGLSQNVGAMSATSMAANGPTVTSPDSARDQTLAELANAIGNASGTTNMTEKARINFVHGWLKQSFILHPEGNISRHALYNAYVHVCHHHKLIPLNTASYGKAVRSCWPGIKTRRLGVRGYSRYHYCGLRPADLNTRALIDYYSAFREDGKGVICDLFGREGHPGSSDGDGGIEEDSGAFSSSSSSSGQDGLVAHMGGLHGLGVSASGIYLTSSENGLTSIPLIPPEVFNAKIERAGSAFSAEEEAHHDHSQNQLPPSNSGTQVSFSEETMDSTEEPPLSGPFSPRQHRKRSSGASSLHEFMQTQNQLLQQQITPELSFADVKTPTAFHFKTKHDQSNVSSQTPAFSNGNDGSNATRLAVPTMDGPPPDSEYSLSPAAGNLGPTSFGFDTQQGQHQTMSEPTQKDLPLASSMTRSASIPSAKSTSDSFALRFKGRRATLPDLHITIPPSSQNPPSSTSSVGRDQPAVTIAEEIGESIDDGDAEEGDHEDILRAGKKTARRITEAEGQPAQMPPMLDLPVPTFDEIIQNFSARLVGSPNHPSHNRHASPLSAGHTDPSSTWADAVIRARDRSIELLRTLDIPNARTIWELYRTSHCRGLLRLAQQGKLEEFEGAFLLFWAQLDATQQALVQHPLLSDAMYQADAMLYPLLLTQLSDRLLLTTTSAFRTSSVLPAQTGITRSTPVDLLQLGHISENLEEWAVAAFDSYPKDFADCRIELASRAAHLLGRLAGVLQLAQALSRTLAAPTTIDTMLTAWYKLDFETITNQCALVTGCAQDSIQSYFDAFKELLQGVRQHSAARASSGLSLEQNHCITTLLEYSNTALERYINTLAEHSARLSGYREDKKGSNAGDVFAAAEMKMDERPFLIKWSYVSGQILRDLIISSSAAFGPFQILALFVEEYLAFRILKNYTLRSDNVAASIQADNDNVTAGLQLAVSAYYVDSATGSSYTSESATRAYDTTIPDSQEQGSKAFLVSPPTSVRTVDRNDTTSIASQSVGGSFGFPFSQPSASVYTTSFDLSNISMNWSPATKYLFGELSLPSAPTNNFTSRSNPAMVSLNTPMQSTFSGTGMKPQMANTTVSDTTTISASGPLFVEGAEPSLAMLPPPTPSAFSSFPNLRSPGLSRYFPSAGGSSSGN